MLFSKDLVQLRTVSAPTSSPPEEELEKLASPALVGAGIKQVK
jgi:hypothetical protein